MWSERVFVLSGHIVEELAGASFESRDGLTKRLKASFIEYLNGGLLIRFGGLRVHAHVLSHCCIPLVCHSVARPNR